MNKVIFNDGKTKMTQIAEHQICGEYKATEIDIQKKNADYRLTQVCPFYIVDNKTGEGKIVTKRQLEKMQKSFNIVTDF